MLRNYSLKIESNLSEVGDYTFEREFTLDDAVRYAEQFKQRVWVLKGNKIVATWNGISWI